MPTEREIEAAAQAMRNSKAWPAVFGAGAVEVLATAALVAAECIRRYDAERKYQDEIAKMKSEKLTHGRPFDGRNL